MEMGEERCKVGILFSWHNLKENSHITVQFPILFGSSPILLLDLKEEEEEEEEEEEGKYNEHTAGGDGC